jgi:hypothetical protein
VLATGGVFNALNVNGNIAVGAITTPGAGHTIVGNVTQSGAGTVFYNTPGNIMALQGFFGSINSTGLINTTGNVVAAVITASQFNTAGNILATGAVFNSERVNGTSTVNVLNSTGNILGTGGILNSLTVNGTTTTQILNSTGNILGTGGILNSLTVNGTTTTQILNSTGNILATGGVFNSLTVNGNESVTGYLNVTGNVLATQFIGNGALLSGLPTTYSNVQVATYLPTYNGTVSASFINSTGNILAANINAGGVRQTTSASVPTIRTVGDQWYDSDSDTLFQFVYDGTNFVWVDIAGQPLNVNIGPIQGTSLNINGNGAISGFLNVSGDILGTTGTLSGLTVNSTITVNSTNQAIAIANGATSGVGNIGATGATFNTVFAKASSAQYADLAEKYTSDQIYQSGVVLIFGGPSEVTISNISHDPAVAGVVTTNPAYLMNDTLDGVAVALTGRVPCWVQGPINKGDRLVSSNIPGVAERLNMKNYQPGCIIGKSLESVESTDVQLIEIAIGRF